MEIKNPNLIMSAFKKAEDGNGYILRLFNPTGNEIESDIVFGRELASVLKTSMAEENKEAAVFCKNRLCVDVAANKIVTLRLGF